MLINPSVNSAQPSFKATLKQNRCLKDVEKNMYSDDYKVYKKLLRD